MKVLVILSGHEMNPKYAPNISILREFMTKCEGVTVEYCGISNTNDFHNYEGIVSFKYKNVSPKKQLSKVCDFIDQYKGALDYDWYIKTRPDVKMLEPLDFSQLSATAVNARARVYRGPRKIRHGMSVGGEGCWSGIQECYHEEHEKEIVLDDMFYVFSQSVVDLGGFDRASLNTDEHEWIHTKLWTDRKIPLNVIGIHLTNMKHNGTSGHVNML